MITFEFLGSLGRLGNQMFQIASTIGIAKKSNIEYFFPNWEYQEFFTKNLPYKDLRAEARLMEGLCDYRDTNIPNDKIYHIHGYLQSHKYFDNYKEEILSYFEPKPEYLEYIHNNYSGIQNKTSIHVRRADYIVLQHYHTLLPIDYYRQAIELIGNNGEFLVFSDDIDWCKNNFQEFNCEYVEERPHKKENIEVFEEYIKGADSRMYKRQDIIELFLMSMCQNNIIANSSYSWWAAYLNKNEEKKIISPREWFTPQRAAQLHKNKENYIHDRIPKEWTLLP